jgi:hypothetical protein
MKSTRVRLSLSMPRRLGGEQICCIAAVDGGKWPVSGPGRFTPRTETRYLLYRRMLGHRTCLDVSEKEKYLYVPRVEPRIIQLFSVTISFCGYLNAALANVFGENSYRSRAVLVCGCGVGWLVRILR